MTSAKKIGEIDLSHPLAGREGVDTNHASRIRVQALLDQHASLVQQTQFADTKSAGMITIVGILMVNGPVPMGNMMRSDWLSISAGGLAALCILLCVFTIFPRFPKRAVRTKMAEVDRFSWPSLTEPGFDADAYAEYMHTAEISQIVHSIAHSNSAISRILLRKYKMLRLAFVLGAGFALLVFGRYAGLI